jgi:hypothetical protein
MRVVIREYIRFDSSMAATYLVIFSQYGLFFSSFCAGVSGGGIPGGTAGPKLGAC